MSSEEELRGLLRSALADIRSGANNVAEVITSMEAFGFPQTDLPAELRADYHAILGVAQARNAGNDLHELSWEALESLEVALHVPDGWENRADGHAQVLFNRGLVQLATVRRQLAYYEETGGPHGFDPFNAYPLYNDAAAHFTSAAFVLRRSDDRDMIGLAGIAQSFVAEALLALKRNEEALEAAANAAAILKRDNPCEARRLEFCLSLRERLLRHDKVHRYAGLEPSQYSLDDLMLYDGAMA